ncbi:MAG: hypothetical protein JWO38_3880 [Gemmataceae bacterium]|nr:hypothetical protein [Gemmataceae bacterium]
MGTNRRPRRGCCRGRDRCRRSKISERVVRRCRLWRQARGDGMGRGLEVSKGASRLRRHHGRNREGGWRNRDRPGRRRRLGPEVLERVSIREWDRSRVLDYGRWRKIGQGRHVRNTEPVFVRRDEHLVPVVLVLPEDTVRCLLGRNVEHRQIVGQLGNGSGRFGRRHRGLRPGRLHEYGGSHLRGRHRGRNGWRRNRRDRRGGG